MTESSSQKVTDCDFVLEYICHPCCADGDGKTIEAVGFCEDCLEFLCETCFKHHLRPTLTRTHKLINIHEAKRNNSFVRYRDVCLDKCSKHTEKIIEFICADHDIPGCSACMTLDHLKCQRVARITDQAEDGVTSTEFIELINKLEATLLKTRHLTTRSLDLKSHKDCVRVLAVVKQMKTCVSEVFEKFEQDLTKQIDKIKNENDPKIDDNLNSLDEIQSKAGQLLNDLTQMRDNEHYCKAYVTMKVENPNVQALNLKLDKIANDMAVDKYKFKPSKQVEQLINHIYSFGQLCKRRPGEISQGAFQIGELPLDTKGDIQCGITGLASLSSDRLVAVDYNNKCLKLVDINKAKVISKLVFFPNVWDITVTDEAGEVVVTTGPTIQILKVTGDALVRDKVIVPSGPCCGIAAIMNMFVVSIENPERLEIIDRHGNVLKRIIDDKNGKRLLQNICSIDVFNDHSTFSSDKETEFANKIRDSTSTIFVPDRDKNTVTCLSLSGQVKTVYEDKDLSGPTCVTVDFDGGVYVGGDSCNIHQLTPDGKKNGIIISKRDGIESTRSICCDTRSGRLFVGHRDNSVQMFQLY